VKPGARRTFLALIAAFALAHSAGAAGAPANLNAAIVGHIRSADTVRVARVREPNTGETGTPGADRLSDIVIEREGRVDAAWRKAMADVLIEAIQRFSAPDLCPREPGRRRIQFGVQFAGGGRRTTLMIYLADHCFEFWTDRTFEGSAGMKDTAPRLLALLKQAFPTDTTVRHLDLKGLITCADLLREHPEQSPIEQLPEPTRVVPPRYPKEAKKAKLEGRVVLEVMIGADGTVGEVKVAQSVPGLDEAAIATVREWEFAPALDCDGEPIAAWLAVPVRFQLP
jgi:TonB family protein